MSSVYFHIPFCKQACYYCDFHFSTGRTRIAEMLDCLLLEWERLYPVLGNGVVDSLYFGGGTPSILPPHELSRIILAVRSRVALRSDAEITLEVNPDDVTPAYLAGIAGLGINRLSLGIQSLNDTHLRAMNRAHDGETALRALHWVLESSISRVSVDLMYGLPGLTEDEWGSTLEQMADLGVSHVSAYGLTLEPGTVWHHRVQQKRLILPDDECGRRQYSILMEFAERRGYRHYEVSNLALPGMESQHNSAYWSGASYLGIGPSAHSYVDGVRWWNVSNNARYIKEIKAGDLPRTREILTPCNLHNEYVMTRLRMDNGMDLAEYEERFGARFGRGLFEQLNGIDPGWWALEAGRLRLTREGRFFADGISARLFADDAECTQEA